MFRKIWSTLVAVTLLLSTLAAISTTTTLAANATTLATYPWPAGKPAPGSVYTHGYGTFSAVGCQTGTNVPAVVGTLTPADASVNTIPRDDNGWSVCPSFPQQEFAVGEDQTVYVTQQSTSGYRIAAYRSGHSIWTRTFSNGPCGGVQKPQIGALNLGADGNLYFEYMWGTWTPCTAVTFFAGVDSGTGNILFTRPLPEASSNPYQASANGRLITPYDNGIAVVNGLHVYYYSYGSGTLLNSQTFSPSTPANSTITYDALTASGRAFVLTNRYVVGTGSVFNLYYKDTGSSTITELALPSGRFPFSIFATPAGGYVMLMTSNTDTSYYYLDYYDSNMSRTYEQDLTTESTAYLRPSTRPSVAVDSQGNVIVVRTMTRSNSSDQEVYIDAFSATGVKTRLFDSEAEFGTASQDIFTTMAWGPQSLGNGYAYLVLCRQTSGVAPSCNQSTGASQIVAVPAPGSFDYPRSAVFGAIGQLTQYVGLGDSYASGEGNPPFIVPTDNNGGNGCDRSAANAYPVLLPPDIGVSLRAFVACSGATASNVAGGKNGEPSQLTSLNSHTDLVTITVGGDDAKFGDLAAACLVTDCGTGSTPYTTAMTIINDTSLLPASLDSLFAQIKAAAPNAAIKVVGYPKVVNPGGSCPSYLSSSEQTAITNVVNGLNNALETAVSNAGSALQFVDPASNGSPFEGHDLCSASPYFFGLNIAEHRFSFHPNAAGQLAYAEVIANNI